MSPLPPIRHRPARFLPALLLVALFIPAFLTLAFPELSGNSQIERRALQDFPAAPQDLRKAYRWPRAFDQFASDRFPFRSLLIAKAGEVLYTLGISISPEVTIEKDGWLFLKKNSDVLLKSRGVKNLSADQITAWADAYERRLRFLDVSGIRMLFIIVPDKQSIYPEKMQPWHRRVAETITDQVVGELRRRGVQDVVDLRPVLAGARSESKVYDVTDSHWNDLGTFLAYLEIMKLFPESQPLNRQDVRFAPLQRSGDLANLLGTNEIREMTIQADIPVFSRVRLGNWERRWQYEKEPWSTEAPIAKGPSVLALCDSYTNSYLYKFLACSFPKVVFMHHNGMKLYPKLLTETPPQVVLYICAERLIPAILSANN